jgi:hypothetical protein
VRRPRPGWVEVLVDAHRDGPTVAWLDLCCGTARALIQAADRLADIELAGTELMGVDLVDAFDPEPWLPLQRRDAGRGNRPPHCRPHR